MQVEPSADRFAAVASPSRQRSAVTNGRRLFVEGDGNSAWSRRLKDLVQLHASDLGGWDVLSEAQRQLVRRASTLELELEQMEGRLSRGDSVDLDAYGRATNTLRRTLETIGVGRKPRDVTPTLSEYLSRQAPGKPGGAGVDDAGGETAGADKRAAAPSEGFVSDIARRRLDELFAEDDEPIEHAAAEPAPATPAPAPAEPEFPVLREGESARLRPDGRWEKI